MKIIGIDFGTKKSGVALSSEDNSLAFPVEVIETNKLLSFIISLSEKEKSTQVVIGESTTFDMADNPVMKDARGFAEKLEGAGLSVAYENEFMSSMQASRIQGYNKKQDASAAAIVLQSYLDKHRTK